MINVDYPIWIPHITHLKMPNILTICLWEKKFLKTKTPFWGSIINLIAVKNENKLKYNNKMFLMIKNFLLTEYVKRKLRKSEYNKKIYSNKNIICSFWI